MIAINTTDDLKTMVEKAVANLLAGDSMLSALLPTQNESYIDEEPVGDNPGLTRNPMLSVKCNGTGTAVKQTVYRGIKCIVTITLEPNESTIQTGIAPYMRKVEDVLDNPALHVTLNSANNAYFLCEGTFNRTLSDQSVVNNRRVQHYEFDGIYIANNG